MVELTDPKTWIRVANFEGNFREAVLRFDKRLTAVQGETSEIYLIFDEKENYLLMVSKDNYQRSDRYNLVFTLSSRSSDKNNNLTEKFEKQTGIRLRKEDSLDFYRSICNKAFSMYEHNPDRIKNLIRILG